MPRAAPLAIKAGHENQRSKSAGGGAAGRDGGRRARRRGLAAALAFRNREESSAGPGRTLTAGEHGDDQYFAGTGYRARQTTLLARICAVDEGDAA
ncbi:MAG: hypothetical protein IIC52_12455 [Proteobacteria bacterium]|nr:hypothetical protein [Pseudomonadota bacterium]